MAIMGTTMAMNVGTMMGTMMAMIVIKQHLETVSNVAELQGAAPAGSASG